MRAAPCSLIRNTLAKDIATRALILQRSASAAVKAAPLPAIDLSDQVRALRGAQEHFQYFESNQDFLRPSDLCSLLEGLWKSALREAGLDYNSVRLHHASPLDLKRVRRDLFNSQTYMQIMKDAVRKLDQFGPRDLPRLLSALHAMTWNDKHLLKVAEPFIIRQMPEFAPQDLGKLAMCYVSAQVGSKLVLNEFAHTGIQSANSLDLEALSSIVGTFAHAPHKPKSFLSGVLPVVRSRLDDFNSQQLARIARAYAKKFRGDVDQRLVTGLLSRMLHEDFLNSAASGSVASLLRALAVWVKHVPQQRKRVRLAFRKGYLPLQNDLDSLEPKQLALLLWSYSKVALVIPELYHSTLSKLLPLVQTLPASALAASLLTCGRVIAWQQERQRSPQRNSEATLCCSRAACDLMDRASEHVPKVLGNFKSRDLTSVLLGYTLAGSGSADMFVALQQVCRDRCHELPMEQASSVLWSFATLRFGQSVFKELQIDILDRLHQIAAPAACDMLWAFCVVKLHDPQFVKALLNVLVPSQLSGDRRCALLQPALLDLRFKFPDMDPEGLDRYSQYVRPSFHKLQQRHAPADEQLDSVIQAVTALGHSCTRRADVDGYVADVLVGEQSVVFYHSTTSTLHPKTREPLGGPMLRQRHFRNSGLKVVNILDTDWEALSSEERKALLERKLADVGLKERSAQIREQPERSAAMGQKADREAQRLMSRSRFAPQRRPSHTPAS